MPSAPHLVSPASPKIQSEGSFSFKHEEWALETKVVRKIDEIPPEDWNRVFPHILEGYDFMKSVDEADFEQFSFYYILVYRDHVPVGAASCFLMNYPLDTTVQGPLKVCMTAVKKMLPNLFNLRALICGFPMTPGRIGITGENPHLIVKALVDCMEMIAQKEKVPIVAFKDFGLQYTEVLDPLREEGFVRFQSLPNTEMEVRFENFEQYLKTLSGATRYDLKRKFKKVDGRIKIDLEISDELDGELETAHDLYLQTSGKGGVQFEKVPREFFVRVSKNMSGKVKYFLWRIDQKLVAFTLCLVSEDRFIDYYLGLDYSVAYDYGLYFIRFRDMLKWCIDHKIKKYEMGNTSYEPKKRLGFNFVPLYVYFKHRKRWMRPLFRLLCHFLKPENFDRTFKEMKNGNGRWQKKA